MAILLSIFMGIALKKKRPANRSTQRASQPSPACWLQASVQGLSLFADLPSVAGCSAPWIKMSGLCHSAVCPCLATDNTPHSSPRAAPLLSLRHFWWASQWMPRWMFLHASWYRTAALGPAAIRPQPARSQAALHSQLGPLQAGCFPGQLGTAAVTGCIYIAIITLTAWPRADQTVCPHQTRANSLPLDLFSKKKTGKASHK